MVNLNPLIIKKIGNPMKLYINIFIFLIAYVSTPCNAGSYEDQLETFQAMSISEIQHTDMYMRAATICHQSDAGTVESCHERLGKFIKDTGRDPITDSEVHYVYGCWSYDRYVCPDYEEPEEIGGSLNCERQYTEAWRKCNARYNGKCTYLGPKYKPNCDLN